MSERIEADYLIETAYPLEEAAEAMAGEQSSGTFVPRARRDAGAEGSRAGAQAIERIDELGPPSQPAPSRSPGAGRAGSPHRRAQVTSCRGRSDNIGPSLPNLLATVAGNLFELSSSPACSCSTSTCRDAFADAYPGPQFGVEGTRRLSGVEGRPLIGTIIKPSVGLSPEETADAGRRRSARRASTSSRTTS